MDSNVLDVIDHMDSRVLEPLEDSRLHEQDSRLDSRIEDSRLDSRIEE